MKKEANELDNKARAKLLREFLKMSEEFGKERVSKIFTEFIIFVLPDEQITTKIYEKGARK